MSRRKRRRRPRTDSCSSLTPQEMFGRGDYRGAVQALQRRIKRNPADADRRLLSWSLIAQADEDEEQIAEASCSLQAIESKNAEDFVLLGWCYIQLEDWDSAIAALNQALQLREGSYAYQLLAVAHAQGQRTIFLEPDHERQKLVEQYLRKAIDLPDCRLEAFLWLEDLQDIVSDDGIQERVNILQIALEHHPDSEEVRFRLAERFIYRLSNPDEGLAAIVPLLDKEEAEPRVLWLASRALSDEGNYAGALDCLDRILARVEDVNVPLLASRSIVLQECGRYQEALAGFEQVLACEPEDFDLQALVVFGMAAAHLAAGKLDEVAHDVLRIAELHTEEASKSESDSYTLGFYEFPFDLNGAMEIFSASGFILETCEALISQAEDVLCDESKGWLYYIEYHLARDDDREKYPSLLKASELLHHPILSSGLVDYYRWEADNIALAVRHHLEQVLWRYAKRDPAEAFSEWIGQFTDYDDEGDLQQIKVPDETDRAQVHQIAMEYLLEHSAPDVVRDVFVPFYNSFWQGMLIDNKMYDELSEAAGSIVASVPDAYGVLSDYAYGVHKCGLLGQAAGAYRELLAADPEDVWALCGLSTVLVSKDALTEALELSDKALSLDPEDSMAANLNKQIRQMIEQRESQSQIDASVLVTRVVQGTPERIVKKPIFDSKRERMIYGVLIALFPNYLVFPNMACSAIFNYDQMKSLIAGDDFEHFLMARVDFCVVSTTDYMPIVAFEVDSSYHDTTEQRAKDRVKDRIFQLGGVPLIRLRPEVKQSVEDMKRDIVRGARQAGIGFD